LKLLIFIPGDKKKYGLTVQLLFIMEIKKKKLIPRKFGPFKIINKILQVFYKLELLKESYDTSVYLCFEIWAIFWRPFGKKQESSPPIIVKKKKKKKKMEELEVKS